MAQPDKPYHRFAKVYDQMGADRFSEKMVEYTCRILSRLRDHPKSILDLCCGTGTAAIIFADSGYDVVGLDGSKYMLKMARKKAAFKNLPIKFHHQQLPDFDIKSGRKRATFDLITCFYDSLNYLLKESELQRCFKTVNDHLNPGGLFIFDMNTFHAFKHIWSKTYAGCHEGIAWIFESKTDDKKKIAEMTANFFLKKGKHWQNFSEIHRERAYTLTTLKRLLKRSGLAVEKVYRCFRFRQPTQTANRIVVVARKPARI